MLNPPSGKAGLMKLAYLTLMLILLALSTEFTEANQSNENMLKIPVYSEDSRMQSDSSASQIIISTDKASRNKSKDTRIEPEDNIILIIK